MNSVAPVPRLLAAILLYALVCIGCGRAPEQPTAPEPPAQQPLPADLEQQVHAFCGGACHVYPPADSFPRQHWRVKGVSNLDR